MAEVISTSSAPSLGFDEKLLPIEEAAAIYDGQNKTLYLWEKGTYANQDITSFREITELGGIKYMIIGQTDPDNSGTAAFLPNEHAQSFKKDLTGHFRYDVVSILSAGAHPGTEGVTKQYRINYINDVTTQ